MSENKTHEAPGDAFADPIEGFVPESRLGGSERGSSWRGRWRGRPVVCRLGPSVPLEVALASAVRHPAVPVALEWGETAGGQPFVLRPFVDGRPFAEAAAEASPSEVGHWVLLLLDGLSALHRAGFLHRDIKSDNVLVDADGVHLVDVDLATRAKDEAGAAGSAFHLAPELLLGQEAGPASDLFSVGAMLALAFGGRPDPDFHEYFPAASFWSASGLDPTAVPASLRSLTAALVRRHPEERVVAARGAAVALSGAGTPPPPALELPFVRGREEALATLVERGARAGQVCLVEVAEGDEFAPLARAVELELAVRGRRGEARVLVAGEDQEAVIDRVWSTLTGVEAAGCTVVLGPAGAEALEAELRSRLWQGEGERLERRRWPGVPLPALEEHIRQLSGDSSPEIARRLAADLHGRTGGSWSAINAQLRGAVDSGVMQPEGGGFLLRREEWPAGVAVAERDCDGLSPSARDLLTALSFLTTPADRDLAAVVAGLSPAERVLAEAELRRVGAVGEVAVDLRPDPSWSGALRGSLTAAEEVAWHERCADALAQRKGDAFEQARHRAATDPGAEVRREILRLADRERLAGRLARARRLVDALDPDEGDWLVLQSRLDVAQGQAERARAALCERFGEDLAGASGPIRIVAALAAEQAGRREQARRLYRNVEQTAGDAGDRCWARMGLAFGDWLDGDPAAVLERLRDDPGDEDPDEPAVAIWNLRGLALHRLGRYDEAMEAFDRAEQRAEAGGDRVGLARIELNRAGVNRHAGRLRPASLTLSRAAELFEQAGHVGGRAMALNNLGTLERDRGELAAARRHLAEAASLRRRVGDVRGALTSLASLAIATLEAGEVGMALAELDRLEPLLNEGGYPREADIVRQQRDLALAIMGAEGQEPPADPLPADDAPDAEAPASAWRAQAVRALLGGEAARAEGHVRAAMAAAGPDLAEQFRSCALALLVPSMAAEGAQALRAAAAALEDAPARDAEAAWRTRTEQDLDVETLERWCDVFAAAGRTDLVWATSRALQSRAMAAGDAAARRAATARARAAAEALTEGLDPDQVEVTLSNIERLAGGALPRGGGLGVDWFLDFNSRMARQTKLEPLLETIVDAALEVTGARRGFLMLVDARDIAVEVARGQDPGAMPSEDVRFSRTVVHRAIETGEPLVITDAGRDERFTGTTSISSLQLRSVLCVPFRAGDELRGALYVDDEAKAGTFDAVDVGAVQSLADQAAIAINNQRQRDEIGQLNKRLSERVEYQAEELDRTRSMLRRQGQVVPVAGLVGESEAMQAVYRLIEHLAPTDLPVLVTGPSGTGKDLVARALHERSLRADGPLIIENVAALPDQLLESEMFGHVRGAFTGADRDRPGLFAEADGGTFVLDEIGEMPPEMQAKLLRAIESGEFRPVGSRRTVRVDARVVAVTNRDLAEQAREGNFREDLYYRLNAAEIVLPPLADRLEDVPILARHFLQRLNDKHGTSKVMEDDVLMALVKRPWPGNVRELSNEVARLYFLSDDVVNRPGDVRTPSMKGAVEDPLPASLKLEDMERAAIERALAASEGRKDRAAQLLGISRAGLYAKLRRLGLSEPKS